MKFIKNIFEILNKPVFAAIFRFQKSFGRISESSPKPNPKPNPKPDPKPDPKPKDNPVPQPPTPLPQTPGPRKKLISSDK